MLGEQKSGVGKKHSNYNSGKGLYAIYKFFSNAPLHGGLISRRIRCCRFGDGLYVIVDAGYTFTG